MRIALTYNVKITDSAHETEIDRFATIDAIERALVRAGHDVDRVEIASSASGVISRLEAISPDLVFNTAEGQKGRGRKGFYPALLDELGFPYTGSDSFTLYTTRDKTLTQRWLSDDGVTVVEPVLRGIDVSCSFVDGLGRDGILDPIEYVIDPSYSNDHNVADFSLKLAPPEHVTFRNPQLPDAVIAKIQDIARRVVQALEIRDFGRCDFRVTKSSSTNGYDVHFLEADAFPSLDAQGALFVAARKGGAEFDDIIRAIVRSACKRRGLQHLLDKQAVRRSKKSTLLVGLSFNLKRVDGDAEAEFDSPATITAVTSAIESFGHTVVPLEATPDLPHRLLATKPDVVFNIAEGIRGRGREAQVPALLELLGIPYNGSDSTTMSLCLDKGLTKQILRSAGIDTPEWQVLATGREKLKPLRYPVIVKPNAEGTSKGISRASVVQDEPSARAAAKLLIERYGQPALVEEYVAGREFTVGLLGERRPRVLPPMEIVFLRADETPVYGYEDKQRWMEDMRFDCPAVLNAAELKRIEKVARDTFIALHCRDVARIDLRMAKDGTVHVIECNPLPGIAPDFSDLSTIHKAAGMDFRTFIGEILAGCIKRYRDERAAAALPIAGN